MMVVKQGKEDTILKMLRSDPLGMKAEVIGEITADHKGKAVMQSIVGGRRMIDMLSGEMLPRIC